MSDYPAFPKIPRWNREVVVTEKIDGTNGLISVEPLYPDRTADFSAASLRRTARHTWVTAGEAIFVVRAGSRKRWITPEDDNFGFATWVAENAVDLAAYLGPGHHYGEWYGQGIQRRYGLDHKRFALFNALRWHDVDLPEGVDVVPVLARGGLDVIELAVESLRQNGSKVVPGFMNPEGVVVFHTAAKQTFKVLLEGDDTWKGEA